MKRIAIIVVMMLAMSLPASAASIRYFTYPQASRTVQYLNAQREMMIYCGYDYEIETYVLVNEVWMERVNSAYYEIWVYGWDAYTGDEIYMPLDLQCVWLYSSGRMYNAAQYLRFHTTVRMPAFVWHIPPYNPFSRTMHRAGYVRSYHYDIHRHGWMPPTPPHHGYGPHTQPPLPPYYMRTPQTPAPAPTTTWTPGIEHPQVSTRNSGSATERPRSGGNTSSTGTTATPAASGTSTRSGGNSTATRSTATTPTRSNTGTATRSEKTDKPAGSALQKTEKRETSGTVGRKTESNKSTTAATRKTESDKSTGSATRSGGNSTDTRSTGTRSGGNNNR